MGVPRVSVKVEYTENANNITSVDFGNTYASWSGYKGQSYENSTLKTVSRGSNPFVLGKSKLGTGAKYQKEYDGYISNVQSSSNYYDGDSQKGYVIPNGGISITISGETPIKQAFLFFDEMVDEYPIVIQVSSGQSTVEYINTNQGVFSWADNESTSNTIVIKLLSWSEPNSLIRLVGLLEGLEKTYDRANGLAGVSVKIQSTTSDMPEYGCIGKTDRITFLFGTNHFES